ncbi:MAG: LON peptidase substrate-binding domain-containing protein, partial [Planctomycetes bacterium]|nr:LON peptidase substrate-binding domain-containing protein [Planctomycetota bacterium]
MTINKIMGKPKSDKSKRKTDTPEEHDTYTVVPERNDSFWQGIPSSAVKIPKIAPVMPIRNTVMFPGTVVPLSVGREKSRRLLEEVLPENKVVILLAQLDAQKEDPSPRELYRYGTASLVLKLLRVEDGNQVIVVHGLARVRIDRFAQTDPFLKAYVTPLPDTDETSEETKALVLNLHQIATRVFELSPNVPEEARMVLNNIDTPGGLGDFLASNLPLEVHEKQAMLETLDVKRRLRRVSKELNRHLQLLQLSSKIQDQVRSSIDQTQREYFLQEQLKAIQKELGKGDERTAEIEELRQKMDQAKMPRRVRQEADRELERLRRVPQISPEYSVIRTYLDWM